MFDTANVLAAGDEPPAVAENDSVAGVTDEHRQAPAGRP